MNRLQDRQQELSTWLAANQGREVKRPNGKRTYRVVGSCYIYVKGQPRRMAMIGIELTPTHGGPNQRVSFYEAKKFQVVA